MKVSKNGLSMLNLKKISDKSMIKKVISLVALIYFGAMFYIYFTQDEQIFPSYLAKEIELNSTNLKEINLKIDDKVSLNGLYYQSFDANAPLIIYFSGNATDAKEFMLLGDELKNYNILVFNYRGYLKSTGKPSEKTIFEDALKIYDTFAKNKEVILIGRSLGSGVATYLASKREVKKLILITPYDSISSIAKSKYFYFPIDLLLKHKFETIKYINEVSAKVAIIEVQNDETIPKIHLDNLLEQMKIKPFHILLKDTTHGSVLKHLEFSKHINDFLKLP